MKRFANRIITVAVCLVLGASLSACSSKQSVNFNIHTEPEGAHVIYKVSRYDSEELAQWIYLGATPYKGVTLIDDAFDTEDTISIKVLRNGYLDQVKEWDGERFLEECEDQDVIFWAPRLVKSGK